MTDRCFECNALIDAATGVSPEDGEIPDEGAISLCLYCGAASVFTGKGLERRPPTQQERDVIDKDERIQRVRMAMGEARRRGLDE